MPRPPIDLRSKIKEIPKHISALPVEATSPKRHYEKFTNDTWNLLLYFERNLKRVETYEAVAERHLGRLMSMMLLSLVEGFERYLKETAAFCIDQVGGYIVDDRLEEFKLNGGAFANHFLAGGTLGKSLCESSTWVNCKQINDRFRAILAVPSVKGNFYVFPDDKTQIPATLRGLQDSINILWQLRHSIVHNASVLTLSDARKLRLLTKGPLIAPGVLVPTRDDIRYVKRFLDETVDLINREVAARLAVLLTTLHASDSGLFDPAIQAQVVADTFGLSITVAGVTRP